jgi:hypothetical protein
MARGKKGNISITPGRCEDVVFAGERVLPREGAMAVEAGSKWAKE